MTAIHRTEKAAPQTAQAAPGHPRSNSYALQDCEKSAPLFGNLWTLKCRESLVCFNAFPGSWDVTGICVTLVGAGKQCNEAQNMFWGDGNA